MDLFWKSIAAVLITIILGMTVGKWDNSITLVLVVSICSMVAIIAFSFLEPIIDLLRNMGSVSGFQNTILNILLKVLGISFVAEITSMVCSDSGHASLGKIVLFLSHCVILWISIPIVNQLLNLLKQVFNGI